MAKFYGRIGYTEGQTEVSPGVWKDKIVSRFYSGDVMRRSRRLEPASVVNSDLSISNELSILADPYALNHFHLMRWVEWSGTKWNVQDIEVEYPRLILTLGGVWHGDD